MDADGTRFRDIVGIEHGTIGVFSQEVRLAGDLSDKFRFTLGANYQHDKNLSGEGTNFSSSNSGIGPFRFHVFDQPTNQRVGTKAVFGSADLKLTDHLSVQGGLRYTKETRDGAQCLLDSGDGEIAAALSFARLAFLGGDPNLPDAKPGECTTVGNRPQDGPGLPFLPIVTNTLREHNLSWRGGLNWKANQHTLLYANITKGFKAGSFTSLGAVFAGQYTPVTQESVLAYEVGFKAQPERRLQLTGSAFYYKYNDKQIVGTKFFPIFGNLPALVNIPKSDVKGAELELTARPLLGLRVSSGITYIHSRVTQGPVDQNGNPAIGTPLGGTFKIRGEAFPNTPRWQFVSDAEYDFPLSGGLSAFVGGNVSYRSSAFAAFGENPEFKINGYAVVDARAGVELDGGRLRLQVWGRNITNKYYWVQVTKLLDTVTRTSGMPVTYGVTLSGRY